MNKTLIIIPLILLALSGGAYLYTEDSDSSFLTQDIPNEEWQEVEQSLVTGVVEEVEEAEESQTVKLGVSNGRFNELCNKARPNNRYFPVLCVNNNANKKIYVQSSRNGIVKNIRSNNPYIFQYRSNISRPNLHGVSMYKMLENSLNSCNRQRAIQNHSFDLGCVVRGVKNDMNNRGIRADYALTVLKYDSRTAWTYKGFNRNSNFVAIRNFAGWEVHLSLF